MTELRDEALFEADHASGCRTLSASLMPCLVIPPEHRPRWAPSPLSYAMHLSGKSPFPRKTSKLLQAGRMMEPVATRLLAADHGIVVTTHSGDLGRVRRERADIPAVTYLDGLVDDETAIEIKNTRSWMYRDNWADGPPIWIRVQAQAQLLIDQSLARVLIVPVVMTSAEYPEVPQIYEELRDDAIGNMLLETSWELLSILARGELPEPDETIASYQALMRVLRLDPAETVVLADERDAEQLQWWLMAKKQAKAGDEMCDGCRRYFSTRMRHAARAEIPGVGLIERKSVAVSAEKEPRPSRVDVRWSLKEV
jgi:hypothetical protein